MKNQSLLKRIELYVAGKLSASDVEALWADLVDQPEYHEYMVTLKNLTPSAPDPDPPSHAS